MRHFLLLALLIVLPGAGFSQKYKYLEQADSLIHIFLSNDQSQTEALLESLKNFNGCGTACMDDRQKALVFLWELSRSDKRFDKNRIHIAQLISEHYSNHLQRDLVFETLLFCKTYYKETKDSGHLFQSLYHLTGFYFQDEDYKKALSTGKETLDIVNYDTLSFQSGLITSLLNNMGLIYYFANELDSSVLLFDKAIAIAHSNSDSSWFGLLAGNKSLTMLKMGDTLEALRLLETDIEMSLKYQMDFSALNAMGSKLNILTAMNQKRDAQIVHDEMLAIINDFPLDTLSFNSAYLALANYYENEGKYNEALKYRKKLEISQLHEKELELKKKKDIEHQLFISRHYDRSLQDYLKTYNEQKKKWRVAIFVSIILMTFLVVYVFMILKKNKLMRKINNQNDQLRSAFEEIEKANEIVVKNQQELHIQSVQLIEANKKLAEFDNFRQATTNMIVHDLKNSLYNIISLSAGNPDKDRMEVINETSKKMLRMVLNILDIRKFEEAKLQLRPTAVRLLDLIQESISDLELSFKNKSLKVEVKSQEAIVIHVDRELIKRVFENIMLNAVNHSAESKKIVIRTSLIQDYVRIEILNWGPVIPSDKQEVIFEPFAQAEPSKGEIRSTGLGLAFCKMAVNMHLGAIGVESNPEKPTCFWFTLPYSPEVLKDETINEQSIDFSNNISELATEIHKLAPHLTILKSYDVYEMSKVLSVLKKFNPDGNKAAMEWKTELEKAVYHCNNDRYRELVNLLS